MKILLVEDNASHAEDAKAVLEHTNIDFIHVTSMSEAHSRLDDVAANGITHVITDLFIPAGRLGTFCETEEPCGIGVMMLARQKNLPCVICTAGHRHGPRYEWINFIGHILDWPAMIDNRHAHQSTDVAEFKDWNRAITEVIGLSQTANAA